MMMALNAQDLPARTRAKGSISPKSALRNPEILSECNISNEWPTCSHPQVDLFLDSFRAQVWGSWRRAAQAYKLVLVMNKLYELYHKHMHIVLLSCTWMRGQKTAAAEEIRAINGTKRKVKIKQRVERGLIIFLPLGGKVGAF